MTIFLFLSPSMDTQKTSQPTTTMETKIVTFTFFSFFFIVSAARMAVDPSLSNPSATAGGPQEHRSGPDSNILLPGEKPNSDLDSKNHNHNRMPDESDKTTNDLNPRANFSRFHPINRHFNGKVTPRVQKPIGKQRRTCRHSHKLPNHNKNPRNEISEENDDVVPNRMNIHDRPDVIPYRMNLHHHPKSSDDVVPNRMNIHGHPKASDDVVPNRMNIHNRPEVNDVVPNRMNIHNRPKSSDDVVPNRMNIHNHPKASDDVVPNRMNIHPKASDDDVVPNRMNIHGHPNDVVPNRMNIHDSPKASDDNDVVPNRMNIHHDHPKGPTRGGDQIQSNWFKVKNHHHNGPPRRHHNNNRNNNNNNNMNMMMNRRPIFDREKFKKAVRQQKQKKREEEAGFMKSIRKFLKHTFD